MRRTTKLYIVEVGQPDRFFAGLDAHNDLLFVNDRENLALSFSNTEQALAAWAIRWARTSSGRNGLSAAVREAR